MPRTGRERKRRPPLQNGHAVVDESALAFIYVGQASYAPTDIARAAFVLNGDAAVAEASLHFGGEGFEDVCQADVIEGGAMRFSMDAAGLGWGFVAFTALDVVLENGDSFTVDLSDGFAGAYGFEVSGAVTYSDSAPEVQTTVYSARGEELVGESLEAMAEGAGVQGSQRARSSAGGPIVIALDAGHDESLHPGADGRGLQEAVLTLEIARYAKEELETYPGVEVYMVRDSGACPYPNAADEAEELRLRVEGAVAAGAHAYVSIHLNSYDGGDASGAEIWYPNSHTNATVGSAGQELSQEILDQLTSLGLYDRGVKDNGTLSDGVRDYYSVIRNSKAHGVPGIIVEHAFITSGSDYGYLSTEEGLRSLGVADAQGIANYFNLRKDGEGEARAALTGNVTLGSVGGTGRTFELVARNVSCSQGVNGVSVGVRCVDDDSQVRWYPLVLQADGTWRATVSIDDFGGAMGTYAVVGALNDSAWNSHVFSSSNVQVAWEQLAGAVSVGPYDPSDGTVEVVATGVRCATGVRGVSVGVWYDADGEASSRWYALSDRGDGTWGVRVPLADLGGRSGSYSVRAALSDGSWAARLFGLARADVSVPAAKVTASFDEGAAALKVEVSGGPVPRATNVAFCVVGPSGSTRWYQASRDAGGAWSASVPRADHGAGACTVGAWATVGGTTSEVARSRANVPAVGSPSGAVSVGPYDPSDGTVEVVATGVRCATGVRGVSVGVWYDADGEASSRWYALSDRGDGTWGVRVPLADLGGRSGSYSVRAALSDGSWAARLFGLARADVSVPAAKVTASFDEGAAALKVEVSGGPVPRATNVAFCVVGPSGSTRWYQASRDAGGAWSASVPRADHGAGACTVGAWATVGGTTSEVARSRANITAQPLVKGALTATMTDGGTGFLLSAQGGSFSDARNVAFALVDPSGRTQWIQAHHDGHGVWRAVAGLSGLGAGPCRVEAWASVRDTTEPLGSVEFSTKLHAIMGKGDDGLVQAFADAYRRTGKAYPAAAYKDKGAPTIDDFCRILVREAVAEGVDPRVVYAQAMLETGYLQFGADVLPGQCNFCGLGATGAGQKGAVFENVALGLRAQVQHLKAYGSKDSLVNACVDPRFSFVSRGVAPYVEGLGGRWAISATYGYSLSKIIDSFS